MYFQGEKEDNDYRKKEGILLTKTDLEFDYESYGLDDASIVNLDELYYLSYTCLLQPC